MEVYPFWCLSSFRVCVCLYSLRYCRAAFRASSARSYSPFCEGHPQVQRIRHASSDFIIVEDGNPNELIRSICRFAMFFHVFHPEENLCVMVVYCRNWCCMPSKSIGLQLTIWHCHWEIPSPSGRKSWSRMNRLAGRWDSSEGSLFWGIVGRPKL